MERAYFGIRPLAAELARRLIPRAASRHFRGIFCHIYFILPEQRKSARDVFPQKESPDLRLGILHVLVEVKAAKLTFLRLTVNVTRFI